MSSKASFKEKHLFTPVSKENLEKFILENSTDFDSANDFVSKNNLEIVCFVSEKDDIALTYAVNFCCSSYVKNYSAVYHPTPKQTEIYDLEDRLDKIISDSFYKDYMNLFGDEFGYDYFYKCNLNSYLVNSGYGGNSTGKLKNILSVALSDEFGIDFYTNNFDNVKFIFVQENFIIPDENEKCHVMQMYDEFNPNHALIKHYTCKTEKEVEQELNSAIDKLVENDKLNIS